MYSQTRIAILKMEEVHFFIYCITLSSEKQSSHLTLTSHLSEISPIKLWIQFYKRQYPIITFNLTS